MNVGFESKRIFTNFTGLGNYGRFIVSSLSDQFPSDHYYLYTPYNSDHREVEDIRSRKNIEVITPSGAYRLLPSAWRTLGIASHSSIRQLNVFHGLSQELPYMLPKHVKKLVTVHDLIFLRYPEFYRSVDVAIYKAKVIHACRLADRVIAISEQTKNDLVDILKVNPQKIEVIYQGIHPIFRKQVSRDELNDTRKRYGLPSDYLLNVGTIEPRKNLIALIRALGMLSHDDQISLVVIGRKTSYFKQVEEVAKASGVLGKIHFLSNASFSDFPALYAGASIFIYPSLFEGFGIPLVEAIACGVPVITSTGSCFYEAAGPDSIYVDPINPEALSNAISSLLRDKQKAATMVERSLQFIKRFEPVVIANHLKKVYAST